MEQRYISQHFNFLYQHEIIYKIDLKSSSMHNHYAYTHRFLKVTPDDGDAETLEKIFIFQITL